jgi:hypothetical protein
MNWIQDNFQIVVILLLALGSWLKARMDAKAAEQEAAAEQRDNPPEYEFEEMEETEWQPPSAVPPPLDRHAVPPALPGAVQAAALEAAAVLKHQQELAARLRQIRETKAVTSGGANATRLRVGSLQSAKPPVPAPLTFRARLSDRRELRRALVMREILNPPPGLSG